MIGSSLGGRFSAASAIGVASAAICLGGEAAAQGFQQDTPIPATLKQSLTSIQLLFSPPPPPPLALFPDFRDRLSDAPAFFRDAKVDFNVRSYYRDQVTNAPNSVTVNEAWATGGWASVQTGRILDVISGGAAFYTSLPLYAPSQYGNTGLLQTEQQSLAVVAQLYGKLHLNDNTTFTAGRYLLDTPFLDGKDNRMIPNTFYGYLLQGKIDTSETGPSFRYGAGYIATIKLRDSNVFVSMSRAAGANVDRGVGAGGALMTWGQFSLGAVEYYSQDTINIAYAEAKYGASLGNGINTILAAQYVDQRATGSNLLTGSYFSTDQFGVRAQLGYQTGIFTAAYTVVDPNFAIQTPWSYSPFYTDAQILAFQNAGENALLFGLSYDFTPLGLQGVAASAQYFHGWANAAAAGGSLLEDEWDFNLEWLPNWKPLPGLWLRARYGHAATNLNGSFTTTDEVRLILNYRVKAF